MIKLIIFDQDGTLYSSKSNLYSELSKRTKLWIKSALKLNEIELGSIYLNLKNKYPNPYEGFISLGLTIEDYFKNVFDSIKVEDYIGKDFNLISLFNTLNVEIYVVTFASLKYSKKLQEILGISVFINKILSVNNSETLNKKELYLKILKEKNLNSEDILVIGDNYNNDILPAIELKMNTLLIDKNLNNYKVMSIKDIGDLDLTTY